MQVIPDISPVIPSKKFITNTNHYRFFSFKIGRIVDAYSWLERMNLLMLEFDLAITWFCEQPFRICERVGNRRLTYTPDTLIVRGGLQILQEVKPYERLVDYAGRLLPFKWPLVEYWATANSQEIEFVTDREILLDKLRMRNLLLLAPFLRATQFFPASPVRRPLCRGIQDSRPRRICDWVEDYGRYPPIEVVAAIAVLYQQGRVHLPLSQELLTPMTLVSHNGYERNLPASRLAA